MTMNNQKTKMLVLVAEDDLEDQLLIQDAFEESGLQHELRFMNDGEELLAYLYQDGPYTDVAKAPMPDLLLLDLNMPRRDGREVLSILKADPERRRIPVVVMTTSNAEEDISKSYDLGVNSYIVKPVSFDGLMDVVQSLETYWFKHVKLPPPSDAVA